MQLWRVRGRCPARASHARPSARYLAAALDDVSCRIRRLSPEGLPGDRNAKPQDQPDARRVGQQSRLSHRVALDDQQAGELLVALMTL